MEVYSQSMYEREMPGCMWLRKGTGACQGLWICECALCQQKDAGVCGAKWLVYKTHTHTHAHTHTRARARAPDLFCGDGQHTVEEISNNVVVDAHRIFAGLPRRIQLLARPNAKSLPVFAPLVARIKCKLPRVARVDAQVRHLRRLKNTTHTRTHTYTQSHEGTEGIELPSLNAPQCNITCKQLLIHAQTHAHMHACAPARLPTRVCVRLITSKQKS